MEGNTPFRITIEHWDEKLTIERDHSNITFDDYIEMVRSISNDAVLYSKSS